jgi:arylsulfatase B
VISLDVFATAAVAAGAPLPPAPVLDGVDLADYLSGRTEGRPHESLYWRMSRRAALRHGDWKLVLQLSRGNAGPRAELFDLATDVEESEDLASKKPRELSELLEVWQHLDAQMIEPVWKPGKS